MAEANGVEPLGDWRPLLEAGSVAAALRRLEGVGGPVEVGLGGLLGRRGGLPSQPFNHRSHFGSK